MFRSALLVAAIGAAASSQPLGAAVAPQIEQSGTPRAPRKDPSREERLMELQLRAQVRIEAERFVFTAAELADIESRYASAHVKGTGFPRPVGAEQILEELSNDTRARTGQDAP